MVRKAKTSAVFYSLNREEGGEILEENSAWSVKSRRLARARKGVGHKWSLLHFIVTKDPLRHREERSIYVKLNLENRRK